MREARVRRAATVLLLLAGPLLALVATDRAIVGWSQHWDWAAREVPGGVVDPYRVEAVLRSTTPGRENVFVLGDSTARDALDLRALARSFADRGLRFHTLGSNGSAASTWGMAAERILSLDPELLILLVGPPNFRNDLDLDRTRIYDLRGVSEIFHAEDLLARPRAHLNRAIGDLHVLARHRRALQNALLVRFGRRSWTDVRYDEIEPQDFHNTRIEDQMDLVRQARGYEGLVRKPDTYPNPHTRGLERLARLSAKRGTRLVVLETPRNPVVQTPTRARIRRQIQTREFLREAAETHGFTLLTSDGYPRLSGRDFRDGVHMSENGRRRFTRYLDERLHALLQGS